MASPGGNIDLLKFIPEHVKYKLLNLDITGESKNVELSVIYNGSAERVRERVAELGGNFIDLDYGFGIVEFPIQSINNVSLIPEIVYVELPKILYTTFLPSNQASCIPQVWTTYGLTGKNVIVGVIDSGIDYTHPAFKTADNKTRIKFIYDIGTENIWDENQINEALQSEDPYSIVPQRDTLGHGTHVTGIACAGGNIDRKYYGVAYESDIIMVKMTREGKSNYTKSTQIMRAIKFLIDKGRDLRQPLVINLSFSTNDGAHDGNSILERYIDTIASLERVSICIAAGNEGEAGHHASGIIDTIHSVVLNVGAEEKIITIQLYKDFVDNLSLEIINPMSTSSGKIRISSGNYFEGNLGTGKYYIYNSGPSPFNLVGEVTIVLDSIRGNVTEGLWKINIYTSEGNLINQFEMWLPIAEGLNPNTKFFNPDPYNTLGIPATVGNVISVGSYNCLTDNISSFSGRGKRLGNPNKPDIIAPGENIESASPGGGFTTLSGTSMAAPQVAGSVALLMQWGIVEGNDPFLYGERVKYYIVKGASRGRRDILYPNAIWGYGKLCLNGAMETWMAEGNIRHKNFKNSMLVYIPKDLNLNIEE
ncbi:Serine protease, subtilisin family [Hathewaya proteolytica DSM 3090]|uniref:Serine protease, subtilisin family n=1 Tax=Hathewaya proteolytica DSM 3090 TaxID=1121331 RepID=A0A1M6MFB5_9CLOT|nr:S8 family peptidase [Hathewaya proteolytica]SHJ82056.1 Serine protease, subtilisin family [Hathewaya proteolytica DSM 3090]